MHIEEFNQLNEHRQNKRKKTEECICTILTTQLKRNKKEILKKCNQYLLLDKKLWTNKLTELKGFIDLNKHNIFFYFSIFKLST